MVVLLIRTLKSQAKDADTSKENDPANRSLQGGGSRTAILALYARSQAYQCGFGPDYLAPVFLAGTTGSNPGLSVPLQACGLLSRLNYHLTHRIFEDQIASIFTLGNTGLVAPMQVRTSWLDDCVAVFLEKYAPKANVVILGSGFDSRCYRLCKKSGVKTHEVNAPGMLAMKKRILRDTGIMDGAGNEFVPCDFETQDWFKCLLATPTAIPFDASLPTLVIWEGVTMYLSEEAIRNTLQAVANQSPQACWYIAFDYLDKRWAMSWLWRRSMKTAGEPFQFAIDGNSDELKELLQSCQLRLVEQWRSGDNSHDDEVLQQRYFPLRCQDKAVGNWGNYGGLVLAATKSETLSLL